MKVFALVSDFPIKVCELPDTPPPTVRAFDSTAQCFVERPKFVQGVFQRLWVLDLLTRGKCQVCVFHAEVCPNALTCCWQWFEVGVGRCYAKPITTAVITLNRDTTDRAVPLAVFMKRICHFIKSPFTLIPLAKCECNTVVSEFIPSLFKRHRLKLMARFDMRFPPKFIKEPLIRIINAFEFCLNRLTWQRLPMWVRATFQILRMLTHCSVGGIRQAVFVSLGLPLMEVFMHLPHIVKQVANTNCIRLIVYLILIGFHGLSSLKSLTPVQWVGRHRTGVPTRYWEGGDSAEHVCQLDTKTIPRFRIKVKCISGNTSLPGLYPKHKGFGFTPECP